MSQEFWVFVERSSDGLKDVSAELLSCSRDLASELELELCAVAIGRAVEPLADVCFRLGAAKLYFVDYPDDSVDVLRGVAILSALAGRFRPEVLLMGSTPLAADVAPRVAANLGTGLTAHCIGFSVRQVGGAKLLLQLVSGWDANAVVEIATPDKRPQMATVKGGTLPRPKEREEWRKGTIVRLASDQLVSGKEGLRVVAFHPDEPCSAPGLESAQAVVACGWGAANEEAMALVRQLAETVHARIAGTRPMVDAGYVSSEEMIGVSGKTVRPHLLFCVGVSGAPHFTTGCKDAKAIFAINPDPQAPIFDVCDVGIVGTAEAVLPKLIERLRTVIGS